MLCGRAKTMHAHALRKKDGKQWIAWASPRTRWQRQRTEMSKGLAGALDYDHKKDNKFVSVSVCVYPSYVNVP